MGAGARGRWDFPRCRGRSLGVFYSSWRSLAPAAARLAATRYVMSKIDPTQSGEYKPPKRGVHLRKGIQA